MPEAGWCDRFFHRRAVHVSAQDIGVGGVEHAGFDRPAQESLRVVNKVGVHRLIASHEDHQRALATATCTTSLLPEAGDGARESGGDDGVEATNVDAEF